MRFILLRAVPVGLAGLLGSSCANFAAQSPYLALWLNGSPPAGPGASTQTGFTVSYDTALMTSESGTSTTFQLSLQFQPTASVRIPLSVSDSSEGEVSPASLVFDPANYSDPQTVTITGLDDALADGNQHYTVSMGPAASSDGGYNLQTVGAVTVTNTDDDSGSRVTVSPLSGHTTTEAGGTSDFLVVLNTMPALNVTVTPLSSDTGEGTVPGAIIFTPANWHVPQKITVSGQDDALADGDQAYQISFTSASGDAAYNGLPVTDVVSLTNSDNDTPGITVTPQSGLLTTEAGGTDSFTVVLNSQPTANVTISITSDDTTEGTPDQALLTFTAGNWSVAQTVTVTGVNDFIVDGIQNYSIVTGAAVSADPDYNTMVVEDVAVRNQDNDAAGITVNPTSGLNTDETGGNDTFTVVLAAEPSANVVIGLSSDNTDEGTVSPGSLTFTPGNWNIAQTVTVTGVDDSPPVADGAQLYTIITAAAVSTDLNYHGINADDVTVTNANDDNVAFVVTPAASLITTEGGGTVTLNVKLSTFPAAAVTLGAPADLIRSLDTGEGTVSPSSLTWTPAEWNTDKTITVTGVSDGAVDVDTAYQIDLGSGVSTDPFYNGLNPPDSNGATAGDVTLNNCDIDGGDRISRCLAPGVTTMNTSEAGGTANASFILTQAPASSVTVPFSSSDTTEFTVSAASLTFTTANWFTPQMLTLTGVNDFQDDGNITSQLSIGPLSGGGAYFDAFDPADPNTINTDNDTRGFTVSAVSGNTNETGTTATFTIRLSSQPLPAAGTVVVSLTSLDTTEVTVSPASLTFTASGGATCSGSGGNWCSNQTVTVTGVNDTLFDGNVVATIETGDAVAAGTDYDGLTVADRSVTNQDNDKRIFLSASLHDGDFDNDATLTGGGATNADGDPVGEADRFCALDGNYPGSGTYRALLVDGVNRRGSLNPDAGDGKISWVFSSLYEYYRLDDSAPIFTANANGIFPFGSLTGAFTSGASSYWTGLGADWTTSTNDCANWTGTAGNGTEGDGSSTGSASISSGTTVCAASRRLLCVEQ
ncbi:MAG: DUF1554 domain-containing protein [Spirochaetales bacterium]|nr:DUF1554 domain-containing protein [Spirochaetales bacterium]